MTVLAAPVEPVTVRVLTRADAQHAVDAVFAGLSPASRYLRFHAPLPRLSGPVRAALVDLDGRHRAAVVAELASADGPVPVGIARIAGSGSGPADLGPADLGPADLGTADLGPADLGTADLGTADVGVAVVDAWQRRGLGRRLLGAVAQLAEDIGYTALSGAVLPQNVAMLELAGRAFPWARRRFDGEVIEIVAPLGAAAWTVTHDDMMADLLRR